MLWAAANLSVAAYLVAVVRIALTRPVVADSADPDFPYFETDFYPELSNPPGPDLDADELHERRCADCKAVPQLVTTDNGGADYRFGLASPSTAADTKRGRDGHPPEQQTGRVVKRRDHRYRVIFPPQPPRSRPQTSDPAHFDRSRKTTTVAAPSTNYSVITTIRTTFTPKSPQPAPSEPPPSTTRRKAPISVFNIRWNDIMRKTTELPNY